MKKKLCVLLFVLFIAGCGSNPSDNKARVTFWEQQLATNIPIGSSKESILLWGNAHSIKFSSSEKDHVLQAVVEKVPGDQLICKEWVIAIEIRLDNNDRSLSQKVIQAGTCL